MEQYISKAALVAEIEKLLNDEFQCSYYDEATGFQRALDLIKSFINTLEVKEVNLEQAYKSYMKSIKDDISGNAVTVNMKDLARHFFELGLKAQKGE